MHRGSISFGNSTKVVVGLVYYNKYTGVRVYPTIGGTSRDC